jgi:nucleoid DNA-binding protein
MNKYDFVEYTAQRYGIDIDMAETMLNMLSDSLADLMQAGQSVEIDGIGEFNTTPLFPGGLSKYNNVTLAKLGKRKMISFKPSKQLMKFIA